MPVPEVGAYGDFSAFKATYEAATAVLRREQDMRRLLWELSSWSSTASAMRAPSSGSGSA